MTTAAVTCPNDSNLHIIMSQTAILDLLYMLAFGARLADSYSIAVQATSCFDAGVKLFAPLTSYHWAECFFIFPFVQRIPIPRSLSERLTRQVQYAARRRMRWVVNFSIPHPLPG
jgi:hypothetical protein